VEDDAGLSGLVGPGDGCAEDDLAPGIRLGYGWRGGNFKVEVTTDADAAAVASEPDIEVEAASPIVPPHERTLGDTFEEFVIIETGRDPAELRFDTGPGTAARVGRFTRDQQRSSAAVAALFREFEDIEEIRRALGSLSVSLDDPDRWQNILLEVFDTITSAFVPTRVVQPDRLYERAVAEIGSLDASSPRDLARLIDATTSPNAAYRCLAAAKLELADPLLVAKPWTRSLEDSSRAVRRAAIRAMAHVARPDLRVRIAAQAALEGRIPL
jgi:hypothetical protein